MCQEWVAVYQGPTNRLDWATASAATTTSLIVTGFSQGTTTTVDYFIVAYEVQTGAPRWTSRYDGFGYDDRAWAVAVDNQGFVYVTGESGGQLLDDFATIAYNGTTGEMMWASRYDGFGETDRAFAIAASPDGRRVFVTGYSSSPSGFSDYATISYDAGTGRQLWVARYAGPIEGFDEARHIAVGADGGHLFVTGYSQGNGGYDFATIAYDTENGQELWASRYDGTAHRDDFARGLAVSPVDGVVIVTGWGAETEPAGGWTYDFLTAAHDPTTGALVWQKRYSDLPGLDQGANALVLGPDRAIVVGTTYGLAFSYLTVCYDLLTGELLWTSRHPGGSATLAGLSPDGSTVFVSGSTIGLDLSREWTTAAYETSMGEKQWVRSYGTIQPGPGGLPSPDPTGIGDELPLSLSTAVDGAHVFVSGVAMPQGNRDAVTVAYFAN